jgi:hypothetical protein
VPTRATENARAGADDRETTLGELDAAARRAEQRGVGREAQVVAGERDAAAHRARRGVEKGNPEFELEFGIAARDGAVQRASRPPCHRRGVDEAQHVGQRPAPGAFDPEHRMLAHVGDATAHRGQVDAGDARAGVADLHRRAVDHELAIDVRERRPRRLPRRPAAALGDARHIGEGKVLGTRHDSELAIARGLCVEERDVKQVPAHVEGRAGHRPAADRACQVVADLGQLLRQVARHARRVGAADRGVELERARIARALGEAGACPGGPCGVE